MQEAVPSGLRPNTIAPATFWSVSSDELFALNDQQLIQFADDVLSIAIPFGTPRTKILTRIVNAAAAVRDGL